MFRGKTWTSKVYPSLTRQTKAEAWKDFTAFREVLKATTPRKPLQLLKPDGRTFDEDAITASGLSGKELTREVLIEMCQNAYKSLAELLSQAGDHEGSQEATSKARLLDGNQTLTHHDLFAIFGYASNIPAWKITEGALPRIRKKRDSSLILKTLADEYTASYGARAHSGTGSYGQYGLVKTGLNVFMQWFGAERSMEVFEPTDWKRFSDHLKSKVDNDDMRPATAHSYQKAVGMFLRYLPTEYPELAHCHTANLASTHHRIPAPRKEPVLFTTEEITALLQSASERTRLYMLLMLNCGMYQQDISDLKASEVDLLNGRLTRARSKTRRARKTTDQPFLFNWPIWPTTLDLLRKHSARSGTALKSSHGGSLVTHTPKSRNDAIRSAYQRLVNKLKKRGVLPAGWNKTLKSLRKTGANIVSQCPTPDISDLYNQYLNHSVVAKGSYLRSGQPHAKFDEAVRYIGQQLGQEPAASQSSTTITRPTRSRSRHRR
jgi:integrase